MEISVAEDFPMHDYQEVENIVSHFIAGLGIDASKNSEFSGYMGGWNALIIRF